MNTSSAPVTPSAILVAEHEVIQRVLDCLEIVAEHARAPATFPIQEARDILEFLGEFADHCHHAKEEQCFFPALEKRGMPHHMGPVAVMLAEHVEGRAAIASMRAELPGCASGAAQALERFAEFARAYVELMRDHIAKENEVLFPLGDRLLSAEDQANVLQAYAKVEAHDLGAGVHEKYLALADDLTRRLGVQALAPNVRHSSCCGHAVRH